MKYPIDKELKLIAKLKIPANIRLAATMSKATKMFKCRTDEKVNVMEHYVESYDGEKIKTYVIEPKEYFGKLPCLVLFHGGGFIMGSSGGHYRLAKEYAEKLPCKVVYAEYRLAPEYKFPTPAEDCYSVYKWAVESSDELRYDPDRIYIGGDSAGGCLAAAVTLMARDRNLTLPAALLLVYPATDRRMLTKSMQEYTDTPVWNARLNKMMWNAYLPQVPTKHIEYASPIEAASFAGFPPTYIEVAQYDCLRDEGILLYERLCEEGILTELHKIPNACHGFETMVNSKITRLCMKRRIHWLSKFM